MSVNYKPTTDEATLHKSGRLESAANRQAIAQAVRDVIADKPIVTRDGRELKRSQA